MKHEGQAGICVLICLMVRGRDGRAEGSGRGSVHDFLPLETKRRTVAGACHDWPHLHVLISSIRTIDSRVSLAGIS